MGDAVRIRKDPEELAEGDLWCLARLVALWIEDGREEGSRSELGVWLPTARSCCGESRTGTCIDATEERRELTLLERRDDIDGRLARLATFMLALLPRRLVVPPPM